MAAPPRRKSSCTPGAVAILLLVDANNVCLLRNFRFPLGETLWEIPAGTLEPGEEVLHAAQRELAEESGYRAAAWEKLTAFYPSPGIMNEVLHVFVARDLTPGEMRPEVDEQLEPITVPLAQALAWVHDGTIRDAKTMIALLLWHSRTLWGAGFKPPTHSGRLKTGPTFGPQLYRSGWTSRFLMPFFAKALPGGEVAAGTAAGIVAWMNLSRCPVAFTTNRLRGGDARPAASGLHARHRAKRRRMLRHYARSPDRRRCRRREEVSASSAQDAGARHFSSWSRPRNCRVPLTTTWT